MLQYIGVLTTGICGILMALVIPVIGKSFFNCSKHNYWHAYWSELNYIFLSSVLDLDLLNIVLTHLWHSHDLGHR